MAVQGITLPGPTSGLNLVDAIDEMDPSYALELLNLVPLGTYVELRKGYELFADEGNAQQVKFLGGLNQASGSYQIIAGTNSKIVKVAASSVTNITGTTTPTDDAWIGINFGGYLFLANGSNTVQVYSGSGNCADSSFSGVTLSTLASVSSYKSRLYFIEKNTLKFWYGNTDAIGSSALTSYDLLYTFTRGGSLIYAGTFTNRLGISSSDLFVACSSEGEILFFNGSYPGDTNYWALVARFFIGKPLGYKAFIPVNNDLWILTYQGLVSVSSLFSGSLESAMLGVGHKINPIISQYAKSISFDNRWQGVHSPGDRKVYISVPISSSKTILLVYCTDSQAWTTYYMNNLTVSNGDAWHLAVVGEQLYYGGVTGRFFKGETGLTDAGSAIPFSYRSAFSFFDSRENFKTFKDIRPLIRTIQGITLEMGIDTNFQRKATLDTIPIAPLASSAWSTVWGYPWAAENEYVFSRFSLRGQGHSGAIRMAGTSTSAPLQLFGFETRYETGGQV